MAGLPGINYDSSRKPRTFKRTLVGWGAIVCIAALLISILIPFLRRAREVPGSFIPCSSNLRQIGQAIQLYAVDNQGQYPPDFPTVLRTQQIGAEVFICRSSSDERAKGDSPQQLADQLLNGHCSYIYVGRNFTTKTNPQCVVAFEDPANHGLEGSNVLFADGHVKFMMLFDVASFISALEQGYNPPRQIAQSVQQAKAIYQRDWVPKLQSIKSGQWSASLPTTRPATQNTK